MNNLRINISVFLISMAIKALPKDWQTEKAIKNLISTGAIQTMRTD